MLQSLGQDEDHIIVTDVMRGGGTGTGVAICIAGFFLPQYFPCGLWKLSAYILLYVIHMH